MSAMIVNDRAYFGVQDLNLRASWLIDVRGPMEQDLHQPMHDDADITKTLASRRQLSHCNTMSENNDNRVGRT